MKKINILCFLMLFVHCNAKSDYFNRDYLINVSIRQQKLIDDLFVAVCVLGGYCFGTAAFNMVNEMCERTEGIDIDRKKLDKEIRKKCDKLVGFGGLKKLLISPDYKPWTYTLAGIMGAYLYYTYVHNV